MPCIVSKDYAAELRTVGQVGRAGTCELVHSFGAQVPINFQVGALFTNFGCTSC